MAEKKRPMTIRDIAKQANVSYQTISLVINNKPGVSDTTRKRILRLMEDLDFQPNRAAQMLTTNRSSTLELVVVDVLYGGRLADSTKNMVQTAKAGGYNMLISETTYEGLEAAFDSVAARLVDGVLLYAPRLRIHDDELLALSNGVPFVRRDYVPTSKLAWVGFDQAYATRIAVEHLIEQGHRQIASIPPTLELINGYWRTTTFKQVLREHDLEPGPMVEGDYSARSGYEAALSMVKSGQPFTAMMAGTDYMAMGALRALRECGLRVPDDVSMVSFDNAEVSMYTDPALTTVDFRFDKQDEMAVKYLMEIISDPDMEPHHRVLMADLVVRESTRTI